MTDDSEPVGEAVDAAQADHLKPHSVSALHTASTELLRRSRDRWPLGRRARRQTILAQMMRLHLEAGCRPVPDPFGGPTGWRCTTCAALFDSMRRRDQLAAYKAGVVPGTVGCVPALQLHAPAEHASRPPHTKQHQIHPGA